LSLLLAAAAIHGYRGIPLLRNIKKAEALHLRFSPFPLD